MGAGLGSAPLCRQCWAGRLGHSLASGSRAEAARARGLDSAAFLGDLKKAYEKVGHRRLWQECAAVGFSLRLLRVLLAIYGGPRRIFIQGAYSRAVTLAATIVAGCTMATTMLRVFLTRVLDRFTAVWDIPLAVYIDDLSLDVVGKASKILEDLPKAVAYLVCLLVDVLGLLVSWAKSFFLGSTPALRRALAHAVRSLGTGVRQQGVLLGCDRALAPRRVAAKQRMRFQKLYAQKQRLLQLKSGLTGQQVAAVAKGGGIAGARYGDSILGWTQTALTQARAFIGGLAFGDGARSLTMSFLTALGGPEDPLVFAVLDPASAWVKALARFPDMRLDMARALSAARRK